MVEIPGVERMLSAQGVMSVHGGPAPVPGSAAPVRIYRQALAAVSVTVLLATLGMSWYAERAEPAAVILGIVAVAAFIWATGWLVSRRALAGALVLDVALVFAYLWSLDGRLSVTLLAMPHGYVARVGTSTMILRVDPTGGGLGLYGGTVHDYAVQPGAGQFNPSAPLAPVASWLRFAGPQSAWSHISLARPPGTRMASPHIGLRRGWSYNRRGELEGDLGAPPLVLARPGTTYRFSADLMRGDGAQGVLVDLARDHGYILLIRSDESRAYWAAWDGHPSASSRWTGVGTHVPHLVPSLVPMLQRTLRFTLPSVMLALTLLLLVLPVSAVLRFLIVGMLRAFPRRRTGQQPATSTEYVHGPLPTVIRVHSGLRTVSDLAALALATWALLVAAYTANDVLGNVPNVHDSVAYLFQARLLAAGRLWAPPPRFPAFFQQTDILMYHGHWFGKYPLGWPLLLAGGVKLGVAWLVNPVLLAGCVLLTYRIGTRLYGRSVALLGTAFAASSPFLLYFAGTFMAHTATLFWLLAATYFVVRWQQDENERDGGLVWTPRGWRFLLPAGLFLGLAACTRPLDTIGFALPFAYLLARRPLALGWVAGTASVPLALGLIVNRALTGGFVTNPYALVYPWDRLGFGRGVGDPAWQVAYTPAQGFWNLATNIELLQVNLFGWPYALALAFAAIPFVIGRARRWDCLLGASVGSLSLVYLAYYYPGDWLGFPRYLYGAVPWLALLAARGMQELYTFGLRLPFGRPPSRPAALALPLVLSLGLLAYTWAVYMPAKRSSIAGDAQPAGVALRTVRQAHIHHALVFQAALPGSWWRYGALLTENTPHLAGNVVYARDLGPLDRRLMRLYPGWRYYRLSGTTLTPLRR